MQTEQIAALTTRIAALEAEQDRNIQRLESMGDLFDGLLKTTREQTALAATLNARITALEASEAQAGEDIPKLQAQVDQLQQIVRDQGATLTALHSLGLAADTFTEREFQRERLRTVAALDQIAADQD